MKTLYCFEDKLYEINNSNNLVIKNNSTKNTILVLSYYDLIFISSKLNVITNITNVETDMNKLINNINQGTYNFSYKTEELINLDFKLSFDITNKKILSNIYIEGYNEFENISWNSIKFISEMFNSIKIGWFIITSNNKNDDIIAKEVSNIDKNTNIKENSTTNELETPKPINSIDETQSFQIFDDVNGFESDELKMVADETKNNENKSDFTNSQQNINPLEFF